MLICFGPVICWMPAFMLKPAFDYATINCWTNLLKITNEGASGIEC